MVGDYVVGPRFLHSPSDHLPSAATSSGQVALHTHADPCCLLELVIHALEHWAVGTAVVLVVQQARTAGSG